MRARDSHLAVLWLLLAAGCAWRPAPPAPALPSAAATQPADATSLPLDPAILTGRLENGLTYIIRANRRPEKRAELYLVVDAGSVLEDEDQRGLAHFVEHMAFNGTKRFAKQELVRYLESIGMRFGPDVNAWTSFDETVYTLRVPTDDPEVVEKGFQILEDWAGAIAFEGEEIDKERGVVIEEWRLGRGAEARMLDRQLPVLLQGSLYAERLPIGERRVLESAPHDALRRFYRDWYRPDLMAVVAVGDFDAEAIRERIARGFAALPRPADPRPRPQPAVPGHPETLFAIATDPEASRTTLGVYTKRPRAPQGRVAGYRRDLVESLYHAMLNARLSELAQQADPPFVFAVSGSGGFARTSEFLAQQALVASGGVPRALETLATEVERVRRHGFTPGELERARAGTLRRYESAYEERDKEESEVFAHEYVRHFLEGEPAPGIAKELELVRALLPGVTLAEVDALAAGGTGKQNRVVLVSAPEKPEAPPPGADQLAAILAGAEGRAVEAWVDRILEQPLVPVPPAPAAVVEEERIAELGVTVWRLGNGPRVVLKPTDFKNDELLLSGWSPGGHSLVADQDHVSASFAVAVLSEAGWGEFDRVTLEKALAGKVAGAGTSIGELEESVGGSASPRDAETLFQLAYLAMTAPRRDPEAYRSFLAKMEAFLANREARPEAAFQDRMSVTLSQGHVRRRPPSRELLREIDLDRALAVYRERFADASDFTFVLVGAFDPEAIRPLVATYLGGLPGTGRPETWRDVGVEPPPGVVEVEVEQGIEPKSQVRIVFHGEAPWSREGVHEIAALADVLRIRLREVLREDLGGVYGVGVGGSLSDRPRQRYSFSIGFGCAPENVETLTETVFAEIAALRERGPEESVLERVRETQRREREVRLRENGFWLDSLEFYLSRGLDPRLILRYDELIARITAENVQEAARKYLDSERYVKGVLRPATTSSAPGTTSNSTGVAPMGTRGSPSP